MEAKEYHDHCVHTHAAPAPECSERYAEYWFTHQHGISHEYERDRRDNERRFHWTQPPWQEAVDSVSDILQFVQACLSLHQIDEGHRRHFTGRVYFSPYEGLCYADTSPISPWETRFKNFWENEVLAESVPGRRLMTVREFEALPRISTLAGHENYILLENIDGSVDARLGKASFGPNASGYSGQRSLNQHLVFQVSLKAQQSKHSHQP